MSNSTEFFLKDTLKDTAECRRLAEDARRDFNWKRWGPYLSERQWATVREDYSAEGNPWTYFPHEHARSRSYRWGEDGLLGITDRECRLCFALALWNGRDAILKERLFGLTGPQGNHGEDVKEEYFYLDSTPTHSYLKALYKYPQAEFPYARLVEENRRRSKDDPEFELKDAGVFDENRYFDVQIEYAKHSPNDLLIRVTVANRGPETATLHLLPTFWYRNTWKWGCSHEGCTLRPRIVRQENQPGYAVTQHQTLGKFHIWFGPDPHGVFPKLLFTENEDNEGKLWDLPSGNPYVKDAFHEYVIGGHDAVVNSQGEGTKMAGHYTLTLPAGESQTVHIRFAEEEEIPEQPLGLPFDEAFARRREEADEFYTSILPRSMGDEERSVARQAYAGLLWTKQFYHYVIEDWLRGDPGAPPPPGERWQGRNVEWRHVFIRNVISMPDKWEYPWFAAWDLAFHMVPFAQVDPKFAKDQLVLFLREWYMHPNGQIPAYEFAFGDVNPPVHAWAAWRVYKIAAKRGERDRDFLESVFQKLLLNFTWWVNRKDTHGQNLFAGGFLGLDNIGVFDRSKPLPMGGTLQQADGTAWMAFYCVTMLAMALELAREDDGTVRTAYEDMASKFFEHFIQITDAMNTLGGTGLWDDTDGFYYDRIRTDDHSIPLKTRSLVGLLPLIAVELLEDDDIRNLSGFRKRFQWFLRNRPDLSHYISKCEDEHDHRLLSIASRDRLERVLQVMLDEEEFLSPYGLRSLSKYHQKVPYVFEAEGVEHRVDYVPGTSRTGLFGGNSNWRGPVWFPVNYLIIEALERYHYFYGDQFRVPCPTGSGTLLNLQQVAEELTRRLSSLFLPNAQGRRACHGDDPRFHGDPHWCDLVLFHEYFHGETGQGLGASHQTGWTALVARCLEDLARRRDGKVE